LWKEFPNRATAIQRKEGNNKREILGVVGARINNIISLLLIPMVYPYKGHYTYSQDVVSEWDSSAIGVYYCGYVDSDNKLSILYIGRGTGDDGMRGRLLDHLQDDDWPDVSHFGYQVADTIKEVENWEAEEIARYKPKYNKQGK